MAGCFVDPAIESHPRAQSRYPRDASFYPIKTEGWGITSHDVIWISDGSHRLWSGKVGEPLKPIEVTINGRPIDRLNELEWIKGEIWAIDGRPIKYCESIPRPV